ncbi:MAG: RtcB family protein [Ignavibacteria bacterium]|nr:RtcB family protein [Ignavibacteria bacterium]
MGAIITTFGELDDRALSQLNNCAVKADYAVLCADHHVGYSQPIGGVVAYRDYISPSGVGFDIGCGNKAVMTDVMARDINVAELMDEITKQIGFGLGRPNPKPIEHPVLDKISVAEFAPQRKFIKLAQEQLGTVGSGNHYVDLFEDKEKRLWIGVHFGSRGFGHKTATGFMALSQGKAFDDRVKEKGMDSPPILFKANSEIGQEYICAMRLAGEYAYVGRNTVVEKVLEILGAKSVYEVHNHHNFAWREKHFGEEYWVIRKGCTPAFPGQESFIGSNMGDMSYIIEGYDSGVSRKALYSTVHGAGRILSRTKAAGRRRWVKGKRKHLSKGVIDFNKVRIEMKQRGIELRGGGADEAPEVYKKLTDVLSYHKDTLNILHSLKPIGVAMAGEDVFDPFID